MPKTHRQYAQAVEDANLDLYGDTMWSRRIVVMTTFATTVSSMQ